MKIDAVLMLVLTEVYGLQILPINIFVLKTMIQHVLLGMKFKMINE